MAQPVRTCIGCGARRGKAELVRLVARDGTVQVDAQRKAAGRGTYVCDRECATAAAKKRAFARALKVKAVAGEELGSQVEAACRRAAEPAGRGDEQPSPGAVVDRETRKI